MRLSKHVHTSLITSYYTNRCIKRSTPTAFSQYRTTEAMSQGCQLASQIPGRPGTSNSNTPGCGDCVFTNNRICLHYLLNSKPFKGTRDPVPIGRRPFGEYPLGLLELSPRPVSFSFRQQADPSHISNPRFGMQKACRLFRSFLRFTAKPYYVRHIAQ